MCLCSHPLRVCSLSSFDSCERQRPRLPFLSVLFALNVVTANIQQQWIDLNGNAKLPKVALHEDDKLRLENVNPLVPINKHCERYSLKTEKKGSKVSGVPVYCT
jgi:hypothetical protein